MFFLKWSIYGYKAANMEDKMALKLMQGLYSFVLVLITALLARYFTEQGMISFYDTLDIPPGTPENHYFSYAWSGIYVLLFLSFYIVLRSRKTWNSLKMRMPCLSVSCFCRFYGHSAFFIWNSLPRRRLSSSCWISLQR